MRVLARAGALCALYGVAVVWLTWPLAAHLATHLSATDFGTTFDALAITWALAHGSRALFTAPSTLPAANIYHPTPHAFFYCDTGYGVLPYYAPPFLLSGNPTLATNLTILGSVALTALATHLVVHRWTGSHAAGLVGAWTLLTTRWLLWEWGPVTPIYTVVVYLPLILHLAATPAPSLRAALWLVPLLVLQAATTIYLAAAALVPVGVVAALRLLRPASRAAGLRLAAALALATVATLAIYAGHLLVFLENPALPRQSVWATIPPNPTELPWGLLGRDTPTAVPRVVVLLILAGGATALVHRRALDRRRVAWVHGALWTACGIALSLTPVVRWFGTPVTLPVTLPVQAFLRHPARLGVVALVGLAVLAGVAFDECTRALARTRLRAGLRVALALALALVMYQQYARGSKHPALRLDALPASYPLARAIAADDPLVRILAARDGPVLELPIGTETLPWPEWNAAAMYRSIFHRRPLLNGYQSYWPASFGERIALANRLPDPEALAALRAATGLTTVVVHLPLLPAPERARWLAAATASRPLRLDARLGDDLVLAVSDAEPR